ncbi:MAG: gluconate:H+ symporter [Cyclobacteriaceae bacterium]
MIALIFCIALLVLLIARFKVNTFIALIGVSILAGILLGMEPTQVISGIYKGMGDLLGSLVIIIVAGAMLGKLVADSGAAQRITDSIIHLFGPKKVQWALMITGFIIGIPLFYNVGFVLVIPLIFAAAYQARLPAIVVGIPMLASLSVTHGFLPPHPSPTALITLFQADLVTTLGLGVIVAIPTVIIAGPIFSKVLTNIHATPLKSFQSESRPEHELPGLVNSLLTALLPVILLAFIGLLRFVALPPKVDQFVVFISEPSVVMLVSVLVASYTLGFGRGTSAQQIADTLSDAVKDIAPLLLIIGASGAFKEILVQSGISDSIAATIQGLSLNPLILAWLMAAVIRVSIGSATVAGLTSAGLLLPIVEQGVADPNLMVLSIGAGSLMFSHLNDSGFWMFKEYFNLSIKDTIKSWSLMETVVAIVGLLGVLALDFFM